MQLGGSGVEEEQGWELVKVLGMWVWDKADLELQKSENAREIRKAADKIF